MILRNGLFSSHELRDLELDLVRGSDLMRRRDLLNGHEQDFDLALAPPFLQDAEPWRSTLNAIAQLAVWEIPDAGAVSRNERSGLPEIDWVRSHLENHYQLGKLALQRVFAYEAASSAPLASRVDALVQIADWDLLWSQYRPALETYERAYRLIEGGDSDTALRLLDRIYPPTTPVALPTFARSPLVSEATGQATGHIEVDFEVTKYGESRRIEVHDVSENVTESDIDELVRVIGQTRFRPRIDRDRITHSSSVRVRYYLQ